MKSSQVGLIVLAVVALVNTPARAVEVVFTFDPGASIGVSGGQRDGSGGVILSSPQSPGSNVAPVFGNFVVDFDPTQLTPGSLQFLANKGGYVAMGNAVNHASPGGGPANVAIRIGGLNLAFRDITWEMHSAPITLTGSQYSAGAVNFTTLSGRVDLDFIGSYDFSGPGGPIASTESGSLTRSGADAWALTLPVMVPVESDPLFGTFAGLLNATAHFSTENVAQVDSPTEPVSVLGGTGEIGGVSAQFGEGTTPGVFAAQQFSLAGLPLAATAGLASFGIDTLSDDAQLWDLQFSGDISGPVTVTLSYDPSRLSPALQANPLGMHVAHFDEHTGYWTILPGDVDVDNHTITFETNSFSPFMITEVPEPSSIVMAAVALSAIATRGIARARRRKLWFNQCG